MHTFFIAKPETSADYIRDFASEMQRIVASLSPAQFKAMAEGTQTRAPYGTHGNTLNRLRGMGLTAGFGSSLYTEKGIAVAHFAFIVKNGMTRDEHNAKAELARKRRQLEKYAAKVRQRNAINALPIQGLKGTDRWGTEVDMVDALVKDGKVTLTVAQLEAVLAR